MKPFIAALATLTAFGCTPQANVEDGDRVAVEPTTTATGQPNGADEAADGADRVIKVSGDVPHSTMGRIAWSPDGKTLGYLMEYAFHTEFPSRRIELPRNDSDYSNWTFRWRPDGGAVLLSLSGQSAYVLDIKTGTSEKVATGNGSTQWWWLGDKLCSTQVIDKPSRNTLQEWNCGKEKRQFPKGVTFAGVSPDGKAIIALDHRRFRNDFKDQNPFLLLVLDDRGNTKWMRVLDAFGRSDLFYEPHVAWNEYRNAAAIILDQSGGIYDASVQDQKGGRYLRLIDGASSTSISGVPRWLDSRYLAVYNILVINYLVDPFTDRRVDTRRIAIYDAKTGVFRPVYESEKMVDAIASNHFVAITERVDRAYRIVVSTWKRDSAGRILSPTYIADDAPRDEGDGSLDWERLVTANLPPLKFEPAKHPVVWGQ